MAKKITKCNIKMYTMGTGDCFLLSFKGSRDKKPQFKLMIDCGVYNITSPKMKPFAEKIIEHTEGEVDALLITHEHQDHVLGFQRAEDIFVEKLKVKELWLPWTENEKDDLVKDLKDEYGKKKKSLAMASRLLSNVTGNELFNKIYGAGPSPENALNARKGISLSLNELSNLNTEPHSARGKYTGGLKGMTVVKEKLQKENIRYLDTGTTLENIEGLDNIRIHILGPPKMWKDIKKEHGKHGETYKHNKELELVRGFSSLPFEDDDDMDSCPFDSDHIILRDEQTDLIEAYEHDENSFRRIDYDWLTSAANLSLRLTRGINNLSAVLAIEFIDSGKVMLFPGDAEFGSWKSWHEIDWKKKGKDGSTHFTTDLLNRTVFYKVAHHLSHNGTAKEQGIELMTNKDIVAMATLDYDVISKNWRNTMPNRGLVKDLLDITEGKLIITNEDKLYYDKAKTVKLSDEIEGRLEKLSKAKKREFKTSYKKFKYHKEFTVKGN